MQIEMIELNQLKPATVNVRKKGAKEIGYLLPSIRAQGLLQPLLVRPNCEGFEVVAGQRRLAALKKLAEEDEKPSTGIPCLVMDDTDDAKAIEASLTENLTRLPMDEIDQFKAFAALTRQGLSLEVIASRFGITERLVRQRLAIANLIAPILKTYQNGDIHPTTLRILTMATKKQQKEWWSLFKAEDTHAPEGYRLKDWLFGGAQIQTDAALFDIENYDGALVSDLFGEEVYFDDPAKFWNLQNAAIAARRQIYLDDGWCEVVILDIGSHFSAWEHVDTAKEDGGKVYIVPANNGEVTIYEAQLPRAEAKRRLNQDKVKTPSPEKPELTKPMQNYLDLHRHAAVRTVMLDHSGIALRLAVAQIIAGSALWTVYADARKAATEEIAESVADGKTEARFEDERKAVCELLGLEETDNETVVYRKDDWGKSNGLHGIFTRLLTLEDEQVLRILTFAVAETLPCGDGLIEALGSLLKVDMRRHWTADEIFLDLLRDKEAINALLSEIGGKQAADGNVAETAKVQKKVIARYLDGTREPATPDWLPRYMNFPMQDYTGRRGLLSMQRWDAIEEHYR